DLQPGYTAVKFFYVCRPYKGGAQIALSEHLVEMCCWPRISRQGPRFMSHKSSFSIKTVLIGVCGLMTLVLVATFGSSTWTAWQEDRMAARTAEISDLTKLLFRAAQAY